MAPDLGSRMLTVTHRPVRIALRHAARLACVLVSMAALGVACDGRSPDVARTTAPNVLLYVVDTLRADSLGCYGNPWIRTPNLDRLAGSGVVFRNAFANTSWTRPSMASLFTGLYPTSHGANTREARLPETLETMAATLSRAGYESVFVTTNPNVGSFFGFARGFDDVIELYARREIGDVNQNELITRSDEVSDRVIEWIDGAARPFFAVVHTVDPHSPLEAPPAFDIYGDSREPYSEVDRRIRSGGLTLDLQRRVHALYAAEVSFNDASFGALIEGLRERGILDSTLVIFTADHGEEFWEYGRVGHGLSLVDSVLRVPLIVSFPASERVPAGSVVSRTVELVDVFPAVLDLLGLPAAEALDGRSPFAASDAAAQRPAFSTLEIEKNDLRAATAPPWKLVHDRTTDAYRLYDLEADEASETTRPGHERARAALRAELERLAARASAPDPATRAEPVPELAPSARETLRALGYVD